jgi:beta-glucosidase/6-phospho-beta-glucosidase/beta-galactosidase
MFLGVDEVNNKTLPLHEALKDDVRIDYYKRHLLALQSAIRSDLSQLLLLDCGAQFNACQ